MLVTVQLCMMTRQRVIHKSHPALVHFLTGELVELLKEEFGVEEIQQRQNLHVVRAKPSGVSMPRPSIAIFGLPLETGAARVSSLFG